MLPAWLGYTVFAGGFAMAVGAIIITVVPALPRIVAILRGHAAPDTPAEHWRRVHAAGDRAQAFDRRP